ncbi:hypothetical protein BpHYR1_009959 [Brachionus plicatilis]|uniref:Uncharacterized protein n=1 Tax=Brachionus plicatilis TaxID=10195 RepID=A0A3M7QI86_BRAPC|nr:hypothetical protein BpHYR1_009959 [Brachionus plicatilis]
MEYLWNKIKSSITNLLETLFWKKEEKGKFWDTVFLTINRRIRRLLLLTTPSLWRIRSVQASSLAILAISVFFVDNGTPTTTTFLARFDCSFMCESIAANSSLCGLVPFLVRLLTTWDQLLLFFAALAGTAVRLPSLASSRSFKALFCSFNDSFASSKCDILICMPSIVVFFAVISAGGCGFWKVFDHNERVVLPLTWYGHRRLRCKFINYGNFYQKKDINPYPSKI